MDVNVVRISLVTFLSANPTKAFTPKNVTRLPSVISLLTCERRALQQLAHQNPLDFTLVAITRHIKAISALTFSPSFPASHCRQFPPVRMSPYNDMQAGFGETKARWGSD